MDDSHSSSCCTSKLAAYWHYASNTTLNKALKPAKSGYTRFENSPKKFMPGCSPHSMPSSVLEASDEDSEDVIRPLFWWKASQLACSPLMHAIKACRQAEQSEDPSSTRRVNVLQLSSGVMVIIEIK